MAQLPASLKKEVGQAGQFSANGYVYDEYNLELRGLAGLRVYDQMRRSDGQVAAILRLLRLPIMSSKWYVAPASDDPRDVEIAAHVERNLFTMSRSWPETLNEILGMLWAGFSVMEKVYEVRDDGLIYWRKWASRHQLSIEGWELDETGGPKGAWQRVPPSYQRIFLPIERLIIFTADREGANLSGLSLLRPAYKHWYFKDKLYRLQAIGIERYATGLPVARVDRATRTTAMSADELQRYQEIVANIRMDEEGGLVLPDPGIVVESFQAGFGRGEVGIQQAIEHHDLLIARSILAQFLNLGGAATGSFALSRDHSEWFVMVEEYIASLIGEMIDRYAIRQLVDLNYAGVREYPRLAHTPIGQRDLKVWAETLKALVDGKLVTLERDLEAHVRNEFDLPELPDDLETAGERAARAPEPPPSPPPPVIAASNRRPWWRRVLPFATAEPANDARAATDRYQRLLAESYETWAAETQAALLRALRDNVGVSHLEAILRGRVDDLTMELSGLARTELLEAFRLGLKGEPGARELQIVGEQIRAAETAIAERLAPDVLDKLKTKLPTLQAAAGAEAAAEVEQALASFRGRVDSYAGGYWNTIMKGAETAGLEEEAHLRAEGITPPKIRWVLDPDADHCADGPGTFGCPTLAKVYDSWEDLPTLPAGNVTCRGNCRCGLEQQLEDGTWERIA